MGDRPPFDPVKASFYLIAAILGVQCVISLSLVAVCLWHSDRVVDGRYNCENIGTFVNQLLTGALAAALAFAGGFTRRPP